MLVCLVLAPILNVILYLQNHDDVIKRKHFPHYWPFVRGIHRSLVNSPNKGQWHWALMFSFICAWTNYWVNNWDDGDLRCHRAHNVVTVMYPQKILNCLPTYHMHSTNKVSVWPLYSPGTYLDPIIESLKPTPSTKNHTHYMMQPGVPWRHA